MNYLLGREDAEEHEGKSCFYCNKVFSNCRALGGHLRIHQEEKTLVTLNNSGRSSNSMDINRNLPASLPISQQSPLVGGNNPTPLTRAPVVIDLPWMFCTSKTDLASTSRFTGTNPRVAQTQIIVSPDIPYGCGNGATYHHNSLAPGGFAPAGANAAMASSALAPSGSAVAAGFPPESSLYFGSNVVCQFNTDEFQIYRDGFRPSFGDAFQNVQGVNLGPPPRSSLENVSQYGRRTMMSEGKMPYLADESGNADAMNAPKRPKVSPSVIVVPKHPETKELLVFLDAGDSVPASKTRSGAEEEDPVDVDLSLHL